MLLAEQYALNSAVKSHISHIPVEEVNYLFTTPQDVDVFRRTFIYSEEDAKGLIEEDLEEILKQTINVYFDNLIVVPIGNDYKMYLCHGALEDVLPYLLHCRQHHEDLVLSYKFYLLDSIQTNEMPKYTTYINSSTSTYEDDIQTVRIDNSSSIYGGSYNDYTSLPVSMVSWKATNLYSLVISCGIGFLHYYNKPKVYTLNGAVEFRFVDSCWEPLVRKLIVYFDKLSLINIDMRK